MMENIIVPKGDPHPSRVELKPEISLSQQLQAVAVLARALLKRIESLRSAAPDEMENLADEVERFEAELILSALIETRGRQRAAARLLGMNITTLNRKLKRYNIRPKQISAGFRYQETEVEHLS